MSRKSKAVLKIERLGSISSCPEDVFNDLEPNDHIWSLIEKSEHGDIDSYSELLNILSNAYMNSDEPNFGLLYFIKIGVQRGIPCSGKAYTDYADKFNLAFEIAEDAIKLIDPESEDEDLKNKCNKLLFAKIISVADKTKNYKESIAALDESDNRVSQAGKVYLMAMSCDPDCYDRNAIEKVGLTGIETLPCFGCIHDANTDFKSSAVDAMKEAHGAVALDNWSDFWLKAMYEYNEKYNSGDHLNSAEYINKQIEARKHGDKRLLHALAWKAYILNRRILKPEKEEVMRNEYRIAEDRCKFEGGLPLFDNIDRIRQFMKESIYTSAAEEKIKDDLRKKYGNIIRHEKNRYCVTADLTDHEKRVNKHMWETTLSLECQDDTEFKIFAAKITDVHNYVCRGGVRYDCKRGKAQILASGDISVHGKRYPFEYDLLVDIAYVSAAKCETVEVKIKRLQKENRYLIMKCQIFVF